MTLPNGEVDNGSKSFKDRALAQEFKNHCEKRAKELKKAVFIEDAFLEDAVIEWKGFCRGHTKRIEEHYIKAVEKFVAALPVRCFTDDGHV